MKSGLMNKAFLITGASGGIGRATAQAFAEEGARLALHYHTNRESVEELSHSIDVDTVLVGGNVAKEEDVETMYRDALSSLKRLDGIVVNAGICIAEETPLHRMSLEQWNTTMATDLSGAFLTCREFLRHLESDARDEASIVFVASTAALFGEENHTDYASAKAAMAYGMTRSLKNEIVRLAPLGRVNCVSPGWVDTPMAAASMEDPEAIGKVTATMALKKIATVEDVANAIVFLSSSGLAGHLSGSILPIAGGMEGHWLHCD